ncbi:MAG TPA: riboflavin synthase [Candidatus Nitrosotalea sp.]|nr:riboflavin synthase [Candidatus Nitrosotalea sp.]
MFTGIVSGTGTVRSLRGASLVVDSASDLALALGSSVAVNGVCLTVSALPAGGFEVDLVPETRRRTNLDRLDRGSRVNLELPLRLEQGLDGHLVQGHVDAVVRILNLRPTDPGREVEFELPPGLRRLVCEKGSVALDGMSLTVTAVDDVRSSFSVALIPHTLDLTVAGAYELGTRVNLEVDVVARYLARLLGHQDT